MSNWENRTPTDVLSHLDEKCSLRRKRSRWVQFWIYPLFHTANKDLALLVLKVTVLQHQRINIHYRKIAVFYIESLEKTNPIHIYEITVSSILFSRFQYIHSLITPAVLVPLTTMYSHSISQCKTNLSLTGSSAHFLHRKLSCFPSLL